MVAGFGDDGPAVGVPDQHDVAGLLVENSSGDGDIIGQRKGRVLDDRYLVAGPAQELVHTLPTGAVDEPAMDKNDAGHETLRSVG